MSYHFDFGVIARYWPYMLSGLGVTFEVTLFAVGFGMVIGLVLALLRLCPYRLAQLPAVVYLEVFRNTPPLVLLIWIYYAIPIFFHNLRLNALDSVSLALAAAAGANLAEVYRAGIVAVDQGEVEAARSLGMSGTQTMRRVVLPQAMRRMIPPFTNTFIQFVKYSSLVSVLGVADLTYRAQTVSSATFRPIEAFSFVAVIYLAVSYALSLVASSLERRLLWMM